MAKKQGINKAIIVGNVGQNIRHAKDRNGKDVSFFSVATNTSWIDEQGNEHQYTEWHDIVAQGGYSKYVQKAVKTGTKLYIEGSMHKQKGQKDDVVYKTTQIRITEIQVMANGQSSEDNSNASSYVGQSQPQAAPQKSAPAPQPAPVADDEDDDIPF